MSLNTSNPNEDISTSGGLSPTLGGGYVSHMAMSTSTATASYYSNIATLSFPATNNIAAIFTLLFTPLGASAGYSPVIAKATILQGTTGLSTASKIEIESTNELAIARNDIFAVTASATNGTDINLYIQSVIAAAYDITIISQGFDSGISVTLNKGASWSATNPTSGAAVSVTSDWAGSGQLTSSLTGPGWAGTVYYEKLTSGVVLLSFAVTTVGTSTDNTAIFTLPEGYRPGMIITVALHGAAGTDGSVGYLVIGPAGVCSVFDFNVASTAPTSDTTVFIARN